MPPARLPRAVLGRLALAAGLPSAEPSAQSSVNQPQIGADGSCALVHAPGAPPACGPYRSCYSFCKNFGAGEGIRTLDPNLGNVPQRSTPHYPAAAAST